MSPGDETLHKHFELKCLHLRNRLELSTGYMVLISGLFILTFFTAISSLGSPYWSDDSRALPKFLFALRALLRRSYATCLITVPGHLLDVSVTLLHLQSTVPLYSHILFLSTA